MIPLFKPFISPEAAARVAETLASGYIGEGPRVAEFEKALRSYIGENIPVNSGTSALWLAYDLAQVQGATVITTPITCLATNIPLAHMGCTVIWADCDPRTGLIDADSVKRILWKTPNCEIKSIRAIVGVDYGGQLPDLETLCSNYEIYGIPLIEDCAHSFGAYGHGKAQFECYSFQAIKHLTTGDGGALCVRDPDLARYARLKRWFGLDRSIGGFRCEQIATTLGYKFHMNDIAASIGLANLPYVNENIRKARTNAIAYDRAGLGDPYNIGQPYKGGCSCWLYTLTVPDREKFIQHMEQRGIQCGRVHSSNKPHPIFKAKESHTPGADEFDAKQVSIPVGYWLSEEDVQHIIKSVLEVYEPSSAAYAKQF